MNKDEFDKIIVTKRKNKDNKTLTLGRKFFIEEIRGTYGMKLINARYYILNENWEDIGIIIVSVSNVKTADRVEIEYYMTDIEQNKGNISIALQEVLEEIYLNKIFDGYRIKTIFPETKITNIFLDINKNNYASRAVAKKSGFKENEKLGEFDLSKEDYFKILEQKSESNLDAIKNAMNNLSINEIYRVDKEMQSRKNNKNLSIDMDIDKE